MSRVEQREAAVKHPTAAADATWRTGVNRVANTGSTQSVAIPNDARGKFLCIKAIGADVQYALATTAATITANAVNTGATPNAAAGATILTGETVDKLIEDGDLYVCWIGLSGAVGYIEFFVSEKQ